MSDKQFSFEKVKTKVSYVKLEQDIIERWKAEETFDQLRKKNKGNARWSFLDGPITANNPMGVHHAWGRTYKDTFQRYHAMNGCELRYQNGFDCQGLWVEVEVEKSLKFTSKRQVNDFGIEKFVAECKKRVLTYAARMTRQSERLGYWMDWDKPEELEKLAAAIVENTEVEYTTANNKVIKAKAEEIVAKLGNPDWGGSYFTFSTTNNETIWAFLKKCFERGKLYRGHDVMPWSGRSGSAYSQMEIVDGRKLTVHTSIFARFPIKGRDNEYILVWTTTPWTLTCNVACAINSELEYVKVKGSKDGAIYYFAKDNLNYQRLQKEYKEGFGKAEWEWPRLPSTKKGKPGEKIPKLKTIAQMFKEQGGFEELGTIKGSEMLGWEYQGPFDNLPAQNQPGGYPINEDLGELTGIQCHKVIDGGRDNKGKPHVVAGEGTGIVHTAPGCGDVDHKMGVALGLVALAPLGEDGRFQEGFGDFTGLEAIDPSTPELVVGKLKDAGMLFATERYPHIYPHCWRNKDELVFRLVDEWFINMNWRSEIMDVTRQINWLPEVLEGQDKEIEWLTNMRDWMISKKRFWGLALPIWVDDETDDFEVMGSLAELKERAVEGWEFMEGHSPHRPWIDKVKIENPKTGNKMTRILDVGNPWLDAGIVPYSTMNYADREDWQKWFPADFITECFPGQFRNWFYALLSMSTMMENKPPFKNILGHALVRDQTGAEMHKSTGNSIHFEDAAARMGVDVMRWLYCLQPSNQNLSFGFTIADKCRSRVFDTLWNTYAFFCNYARLDGFVPAEGEDIPVAQRPEIDRWLLSNLQKLIQRGRECFDKFDLAPFIAEAETFIDDMSNWYVRRNRRRFWRSEDNTDKRAAYLTLHKALLTLTQILAPVTPFITEVMYEALKAGDKTMPQSVHHCSYPTADESLMDEALSSSMDAAIRLVSMGRSVRNANKLHTRQPLARMTLVSSDPTRIAAARTMQAHIQEELNIKSVEILEDAQGLVEYRIQPNLPRLGPRYGRHLGAIRKAIGNVDATVLAAAQKSGEGYDLDIGSETIKLESEDILVKFQWQEGFTGAEDQGTLVALDTVLTPELECEGWSRDLIRFMQEARKAAGLEPQDRIHVAAQTDSEKLSEALKVWNDNILSEILCLKWASGLEEGKETRDLEIRGESIRVQISKA
jgi:isoleucyl-tRNA synthetase